MNMLAAVALVSCLHVCYGFYSNTKIDITDGEWDYGTLKGTNSWGAAFPTCSGSSKTQSPIPIDSHKVWHSAALTAFDLQGYETIPARAHWNMRNDGKTLVVNLSGRYLVSEGGLDGMYRAAEIRFHWGMSDIHGSEHSIDNHYAPLEMQIVMFSEKFRSLQQAYGHDGGVAIQSFLFEIHGDDNPGFSHLFAYLKAVAHPGDSVDVRPVSLMSLLPLNLNNYYRYEGSTTTPPCHQKVIWTVFSDKITISKRQMSKLRLILKVSGKDEANVLMGDNYRPQQPVGGRTIYSSDPKDSNLLTSPLHAPLSVTLAVLFGFVLLLIAIR